MVTTRSMSISGTKTAVNDKAAQRGSITTTAAQRGSGTTTRTAVNDKVAQYKKITGKCTTSVGWTVMNDAYCLFVEDYKEKNREKYPPPSTGAVISFEFTEAIMQEWRVMSSKDKSPFIKSAKKMRAKGLTKLV